MTRENRISCEADLGQLMVVGNHDAKAIVLGGMQPGLSYGPQELHEDLFLEPQGERPTHIGSSSNQLDYCIQSFEPAGCVTRTPSGTVEYRLTKLGQYEGKAFAGHVLALSLEAGDIGLRSLFGLTKTNGGKESRPPLDRLRIFRMLLDSDDLQATDVKTELGASTSTAVNNLVWLDAHGVVEYHAVDGRDIADNIIYGLPERFALDSAGLANGSIMRRVVHETVAQLVDSGERECSLSSFTDMLKKHYPDEGFERSNRRIYARIMMDELVAGGHVTKGPIQGTRKSSITLRDEARPIVARSVAIADGMLSGDAAFMREGREQLRDILDDEDSVRTLIAKAFKASPTANRIPFADRAAHVLAFLAQGSASSGEVITELERHGMTASSTKNTLQNLRRTGDLVSESIPGTRELAWERRVKVSPAA